MTKKELIALMREAQAELKVAETAEAREAAEKKFNEANRELIMLEHADKTETPSFSLTTALREAMHGKKNQFEVREAITATGLSGKAVETVMQEILEPLYAQSVLTKLGVRWYKGMPMGNISIPVMNKGQVAWAGETAAATDGTPTFGTNIELKPKRLTGYFDISEQMLLQDTIGVEQALRREAINALIDAFEATVLGNAAGTANKPAGLFYNATLANATDFKKVCELEASVEDNCIGGEMKYLLSTKAKADFRSMAKSSKSTQLVMEGGTIDGTPAITTQNVKNAAKGVFAYGNFANLACASWADLIFKVDDSIVYGNGKIRIYVSGYFDAAVLRAGAFAFGDTRATA